LPFNKRRFIKNSALWRQNELPHKSPNSFNFLQGFT
jgi:hypothetical protein